MPSPISRSKPATIIGTFSLLIGLTLSACQAAYSGQVESLTLGMDPTAVNSLIQIAADQDYFAANGLEVNIKTYPSGLAAVDAMLHDEVDVATAAEFVIVNKALGHERIRTFGAIDRFLHIFLVGRTDRGIENFSDLIGKKIGVSMGTAPEFYLGRFLELHGMNLQQVTLVNLAPQPAVEALANGEVDAVIAWEPNVTAIEDRLGDRLVKWPAQNSQAAYCLLISTNTWIADHPEVVARFLNAIAAAEKYLASNPREAQALLQTRLQYDEAFMARIWPQHQFSLSLSESLLLAMKDEARWMIANNLTTARQVPDLLDYIYEDALKAIRPETVSIIR